MTDVTALLIAAQQGDSEAESRLYAALYSDLRRIAHARLSRSNRVIDTTALVHESFLRFRESGEAQVESRAHFFGYAARAMRSVIVDLIREASAGRRGGGASPIPIDSDRIAAQNQDLDDVLRVHAALDDLAKISERLVRVVEMRYFAGMSEIETAEALGITERTVRRDWEKARMLLAASLR